MNEQIKLSSQIAAILLAFMFLAACGTQFMSAKTVATYEADGKKISYESTKEQQGIILDIIEENGKVKSIKIRADKSSTNDESVAASLMLQMKMIELLQQALKNSPK